MKKCDEPFNGCEADDTSAANFLPLHACVLTAAAQSNKKRVLKVLSTLRSHFLDHLKVRQKFKEKETKIPAVRLDKLGARIMKQKLKREAEEEDKKIIKINWVSLFSCCRVLKVLSLRET